VPEGRSREGCRFRELPQRNARAAPCYAFTTDDAQVAAASAELRWRVADAIAKHVMQSG